MITIAKELTVLLIIVSFFVPLLWILVIILIVLQLVTQKKRHLINSMNEIYSIESSSCSFRDSKLPFRYYKTLGNSEGLFTELTHNGNVLSFLLSLNGRLVNITVNRKETFSAFVSISSPELFLETHPDAKKRLEYIGETLRKIDEELGISDDDFDLDDYIERKEREFKSKH